jgi:ergothioneine biosynthesis protein EgtB
VDAAVLDALERAPLDLGKAPEYVCGRTSHAEALYTALEHEAMHQETLLYMWRRLPYDHKKRPAGLRYEIGDAPPPYATAQIPAGRATLGARRDQAPFGWDNEFDELALDVPAFEIDAHSVTNADFLEFMADGGYDRSELWSDVGWEWRLRENVRCPAFWIESSSLPTPQASGQWFWRGMFEPVPLPLAWPVYVSQAEAAAYARWKARRLPTEAEYHRAAFGTASGEERSLPWGNVETSPVERGNLDFASWEPVPAGSRPAGASAWGVHDLVGNGWEWTSTEFAPFPGFHPMASYPEYSAEFFDGHHIVLKGASPATARELVRRSFRNWFRPNYPYVYAKFRTVSSLT